MTKVSVFGKETEEEKKKNPIEFVKALCYEKFVNTKVKPSEYGYVVLLEKNYDGIGLSLIWAYEDRSNFGTLYLGHWNDGVV